MCGARHAMKSKSGVIVLGIILVMSAGCGEQPENVHQRPARIPDFPVTACILNRFSSYAISGEPISNMQLFTLFEAARWAPSSYNSQPWRFIYAKRETPAWDPLFNLLVEFNQLWARNAAVLVVIISAKLFNHHGKREFMSTHSFDTGAAWENFAIQGAAQGLVVRGIAGFDYEAAYKVLHVPAAQYTIEAMCAIGKSAHPQTLPQFLRAKEEEKAERKPIKDFVYEGVFKE